MTSETRRVAPWAQDLWERDAASQALGMELVEAGDGQCVIRMTVRPDMIQGHGTCHGGIIFSLADSAFAFACNGPDEVVVGASADVTWVSAARPGDVLVAEAVQETRFGRGGVTRVRVSRADDRALVALFQGRSLALPTDRRKNQR